MSAESVPIPDLSGSQTLLSAIVNSAIDSIVVLDSRQRVILFNPSAAALFGYKIEEIIGQPIDVLIPTRLRAIHTQHIVDFGTTGETTRSMGHLRPLAARRRDGGEFPIEATISQVVIDGERYYSAILRDITLRIETEAARLAALEREAYVRAEATAAATERDRLQEILEGLPGGLFIVSGSTGAIEFANSAFFRLLGRSRTGPDDLPVVDREFSLLRADGLPLPGQNQPGTRGLAGERVRNQQLILQREDGTRIPVSAHAAHLSSRDLPESRAIVVIQDVTRVRESEQLKDDFLDLISHEFRTPVTAIHGGAHLLAQQGEQLDELARTELLNDMVVETERLEQMLTNILTVSNVLAGRLMASTEPVLIGPLVRLSIADLNRRFPSHTFATDIPLILPAVEADPALLEQVLHNLYENAVKYSPAGGPIEIRAASDDGKVSLSVIDHGIGIDPEMTGAVFERFRRVGSDPTVRGMGLGLYLSRHLIEAQGGTIRAESDGIGRGTTLTISLPIATGWDDDE